MILVILVLLCGFVLVSIGVYQMKTYYGQPHEQEVTITGYVPYRNGTRGLTGLAVDGLCSAVGLKHPVVDITLEDGAVQSVRLHDTVNDMLIGKYPELGLGGKVYVQYFGNNPKIAYLKYHDIAQTVVQTSILLLAGIAVTVLGIILLAVYILTPAV